MAISMDFTRYVVAVENSLSRNLPLDKLAHGRMMRFSSVEEKNKEIDAMMDFFQQERGMRGRIGIHVVGQ